MAEYENVEQAHTKVDNVFYRMHRYTAPRTWIVVLVVEIMDGFVKRWPVDHTVGPKEVRFAPVRNEDKKDKRPERMVGDRGIERDFLISPEIQISTLVKCPYNNARSTTPKDIFQYLITEEKF
jgi:uncharacterized Fe-S cluster-containing MiaB family protein